MRKIQYLLCFIFFLSFVVACKKEEKPAPIADFTYKITSDCTVPAEVKFTNKSTNASVYRWNFGDKSKIEYGESPIHTFLQEGVDTVELTAYGNGGMSVKTQLIFVVQKPIIKFSTLDTIRFAGELVHFTDSIGLGVFPPTLLWSFGDGFNSSDHNPSHSYTYPGKYTVTLTATNACGRTDVVKTNYIRVDSVHVAPVVDFVADRVVIGAGQTVNFFDLSANFPNAWNWSFSGAMPGTSNNKNPFYITYPNPGLYDVSLTASNSAGSNTISKTTYIQVLALPVADFSGNPTTITTGGFVSFTDLSQNSPTTWNWTFNGGTPSSSNLQVPPNIVYTASGVYDASLTISNGVASSSVTKSAYIHVNTAGSAPVANFIANNLIISPGQSVNFTDLSANIPTSWNWTFNGGTPSSSNLQNPLNVVYNIIGNYNVTLNATNANGSNAMTKTAYIHVQTGITKAYITKITVQQMNFPPPPQPQFVNVFYQITDTLQPATMLKNGESQIMMGTTAALLPTWTITPQFQVPSFNQAFRVELIDRRQMTIYNPIGFVRFKLQPYTMGPGAYPPSIVLTQGAVTIKLDLLWQ